MYATIVTIIAAISICFNIVLFITIVNETDDESSRGLEDLDVFLLKVKYEELKTKFLNLAQENIMLKQNAVKQDNRNTKVSSDTLEAVKYAMNKAHPDNGGTAEKFMKYKKCYDDLRGEK